MSDDRQTPEHDVYLDPLGYSPSKIPALTSTRGGEAEEQLKRMTPQHAQAALDMFNLTYANQLAINATGCIIAPPGALNRAVVHILTSVLTESRITDTR